MDFTIDKYGRLLDALKAYGFESLTLRHDVDLLPGNSLRTARMEAEKVILVVPKPYISAYPPKRRDRVWTIKRFVDHVREIEGK